MRQAHRVGLPVSHGLAQVVVMTVALTPELPGTYVFYCSKRGMEGTLVVTPASH